MLGRPAKLNKALLRTQDGGDIAEFSDFLAAKGLAESTHRAYVQSAYSLSRFLEDPLRPQFREHLDAALERCVRLRNELVEYIGDWDLPDNLAEAPAMLEKLAERVLR